MASLFNGAGAACKDFAVNINPRCESRVVCQMESGSGRSGFTSVA